MINKVLCIDDDPVTLIICGIMLQKTNFCNTIVEANSGPAGLRYFEGLLANSNSEIPDLILLDINMPVMNGWEFIEEFVEKYKHFVPDCKIVILTSSLNPEDNELAKNNAHVIDFIPKPLSLNGLENLKQNAHLEAYFGSALS